MSLLSIFFFWRLITNLLRCVWSWSTCAIGSKDPLDLFLPGLPIRIYSVWSHIVGTWVLMFVAEKDFQSHWIVVLVNQQIFSHNFIRKEKLIRRLNGIDRSLVMTYRLAEGTLGWVGHQFLPRGTSFVPKIAMLMDEVWRQQFEVLP